jgi:asparagine synthase (glutamine-hydrolysing)
MSIDFKTYQLDNILVKVDRATMSVGLEGREPLLDKDLINFVTQIDDKLKFKDGNQKYLLKKITHKYVPKELVDRPKKGFGVPIEKILSDSMPSLLEYYFSTDFIINQGIFNENEINRLMHNYSIGNNLLFPKIWNLLIFQMWYSYWFIQK